MQITEIYEAMQGESEIYFLILPKVRPFCFGSIVCARQDRPEETTPHRATPTEVHRTELHREKEGTGVVWEPRYLVYPRSVNTETPSTALKHLHRQFGTREMEKCHQAADIEQPLPGRNLIYLAYFLPKELEELSS